MTHEASNSALGACLHALSVGPTYVVIRVVAPGLCWIGLGETREAWPSLEQFWH
jgi:hypothetical protein